MYGIRVQYSFVVELGPCLQYFTLSCVPFGAGDEEGAGREVYFSFAHHTGSKFKQDPLLSVLVRSGIHMSSSQVRRYYVDY